jgi:hypothetical protein
MEMLMKSVQLRPSDHAPITLRSLLSASVSHRVFAVLLVLFIAAVTIASTMGARPLNSGANLIMAPGQPGLEPALY